MKLLLIITAVLEAAGGLSLLVIPTIAISVLLGVPLDTPGGLVAVRIAGAALIALAIACWQVRNDERESPRGVVEAMLFYNFATAMALVHAGIRLELRGALLWPAIVLHVCLGLWCVLNVWSIRRKIVRSEMTS